MNEIGADSNDLNKHFKLCADIDLSGFTGTSFNIIGIDYDNRFRGVFDGSGHTISNFTYTSTGTNFIGLFTYVRGENAEIKNLGLIAPNLDAGIGSGVGSLVGPLSNGIVTNCYVRGGSISGGGSIGGLVGLNYDGTITNCYSTGIVSGITDVGGLLGLMVVICDIGSVTHTLWQMLEHCLVGVAHDVRYQQVTIDSCEMEF